MALTVAQSASLRAHANAMHLHITHIEESLVEQARALLARQQHAVRHHATCDLCNTSITGVRWKCLQCPDWDTCGTCFATVGERHPGHGFVKVESATQLVAGAPLAGTVFPNIRCDACNTRIRDVRFKVSPHRPLQCPAGADAHSACTRAARTTTSAHRARRSRSASTQSTTRCSS